MVCSSVCACTHAFIHSLPSLSWSAPASTLLSSPASLFSSNTGLGSVPSKLQVPSYLGVLARTLFSPLSLFQISSGKTSRSPCQLDVVPLFYSLGFPSFFVLSPPIIVLVTFCKEYFCNFLINIPTPLNWDRKPYLLCSPFKSSSFNTMPVIKIQQALNIYWMGKWIRVSRNMICY